MQMLTGGESIDRLGNDTTIITFFDGSLILFSALATALVVAGALLLRRSRLRAYTLFQKSILVSLFFTQPLLFYRDQWGALLGFTVDILVFLALRFMIEHERTS